MSQAEFEKRFLYRTKNVRRLRKPRNAECPFLSQSGCTIHAVKPTQCRVFPLWPEIVDDTKEMVKTAKWCPGIGKGAIVTIEEIRKGGKLMRDGYPHMYDI